MSFLSRFGKSRGKDKSSSPSKKQQITPTSSPSALLPLALPSTSLLDDSLQTTPSPQKRGDESSSIKSSVGSSPWVKVDEGGVEQEEGLRGRKEREAREQSRCDRAVFGVAEATVLMKECGAVIRDHGLTTLGLFRPYRLAENPSSMRQLSILFLNYANDHSKPAGDSVASDLFGAGSKDAKLKKFREELKYAGVHDVVGVLKWGLRHLQYATPFGGPSSSSPDSPLAWYHNFFLSSAESYHNTSAFHLQLLPSLPPSSSEFLQATLDLLQSVVAHAEHNAMGSRKLCRTLGLYVFGLAPRDRAWNSEGGWTELYSLWQQAGEALEGCLRAYLRSQTSLPPRLMEVIEGYPGPSPSTTAGGKDSAGQRRRVVKVELESTGEWSEVGQDGSNSQQTGRVEGGLGGKDVFARREPLQIMLAAFEASDGVDGEEKTAGEAWKVIAAQGKGAPREILSEETARVLELVGLDKLPGEATSEDDTNPSFLSTTPTRPRRRSLSGTGHDAVAPSLTVVPEGPIPFSSYHPSTKGRATIRPRTAPGPSTNFPNKSVGNLTHGQFPSSSSGNSTLRQQPPSRIVTPSWSEFASAGFSDAAEFGLISPGSDEFPTRGVAAKAQEILAARNKGPDPVTKIVAVTWWIMEDEFVDVWLDTLVDQKGACEGWPGLVVAQLARELTRKVEAEVEGEKVDHLLIAEKLIPYVSPATLARRNSTRDATPSIAESTRSRKWGRRASTLFGSSSFNNSTPKLSSTSPQTSPKKSRASVVPPLPSFPSSTSTATTSQNGPPVALGGLVSRTFVRRKSGQNDFPRPLSTVEDVPPVPPLPVSALPLAPTPASVPMAKSASGASTPASTSSGREKKISRVAVPVFDPEAEKEKQVAVAREEQGGEAKEVLATEVAEADPAAPTAVEQDISSPLPVVATEDGEEHKTGLSTSAKGLLVGLAAAPVLGAVALVTALAHDGEKKEEQTQEQPKEVAESKVEDLQPDANDKPTQPSSTEEAQSSDLASTLTRSSSVSNVPPLVAVNVEQMEQHEPLAALVDSASQLETATADPEFNSEGVKEILAEPGSLTSSPVFPFARRGSAQSSINDKPFGRRPSAPVEDEGGLDIAQFVAEDEAIAAAEATSSPFPALGAVAESTAPLDSTPVLEIKNPIDPAPATSNVPDAPAIDALLADPPSSDPVTPLAEPTEPAVSAIEEPAAIQKAEEAPVDAAKEEFKEEQVSSPTFSLSPPAGEPEGDAQRFSDETLRSPDEHGLAATVDAPAAEPLESPVAGVVEPAISSPLETATELPATESAPIEGPPLVATPSKPSATAIPETPISPTTLSPTIASADLSRSLSQTSQFSVPKSPSPSNGSASSTSKKLLGTVGGFLRRKKSSVEQEKERLAKEEKAAQKEEIRQLKKLKDEERKREAKEKKAPTPVSSVKKRVLEIEAEAAELSGGAPPSPTAATRRLSSYPSNTSLSSSASKTRPLSSFVLPASPPQETVHHDAKEPAPLEELPSALPTPTPASPEDAAPLAESTSDDPFLVESSSTAPLPAPEFAPSSLFTGEGSDAQLDAPTTPTTQSAPLPALSALAASESTPTKPTTPALESAEEGHSAFAEPTTFEAPEPVATPSLEAAEEGVASPEEPKSPVPEEEPKTFEAYPEGAPAAAAVVAPALDEVKSTGTVNEDTAAVAEEHSISPSTALQENVTTTISSPVDEPSSPPTPTAIVPSPSTDALPPPSTPPHSVEPLPSFDSLATPRKEEESATATTPRQQEVEALANTATSDDAPVQPLETLSTPPKSSSPALRNSASDNSMATSFQTAASEAGSVSTTATDDRPWEQAETGL